MSKLILYAKLRVNLFPMLRVYTQSISSQKDNMKKQPNILVKPKEPSSKYSLNFCKKIQTMPETALKYIWKPDLTNFHQLIKVKDVYLYHG